MAIRPYLIPIPRSRHLSQTLRERLFRTRQVRGKPPEPIGRPLHDPVPDPPSMRDPPRQPPQAQQTVASECDDARDNTSSCFSMPDPNSTSIEWGSVAR
jgi:hypothetical protein